MLRKLSVLGGSSPFTVALIDALAAEQAALPIDRLTLHGRSAHALQCVAGYARARLAPGGWTVSSTSRTDEALEGSRFVVQQIRFGGLEGRAVDEHIAAACGLAADETLGPAALHCILRTAPRLRELGALIARHAPDAWVLNLSNPLSITTALLVRAGVERCIGVCELPQATANGIERLLDHAAGRMSWRYAGFNHRGFLVDLRLDGVDLLPRLVERLGDAGLAGIPTAVIESLQAVPTKYFGLLLRPQGAASPSRARIVAELRERVLRALEAAPGRYPEALRGRQTDWYPLAVVPLLKALGDPAGSTQIVNMPAGRGVVEEQLAHVAASGIRSLPAPVPSPATAAWIDRYRRHEEALLAVAEDPSDAHIARAVRDDPMLARSRVRAVTARLVAARPPPAA